MRKAVKNSYRLGYLAAKQGQLINANPYGCDKGSKKYAWLGGYSDYLLGHELDLSIFK